MPILKNVTFGYVKLQKPVTKYESDELVYELDAIVDEETAKAFGKQFKKQKAKEYDNDDFTSAFKIEPVYEDQDEQYVLKFRRPATYKDGNPIAEDLKPKVLVKGANGKLKNIAKTTLVANGSKGSVEYDIIENSYGTFTRLKNIMVTDLIEYQSANSSEFGEVDNGDSENSEFEDQEVPTPKETKPQKKAKEESDEEDKPKAKATKAAPKPAPKAEPVDEEDEDAPF